MITTEPSFHPRTLRRMAAASRIHDLLRSSIMHGELPSGVLPGEPELMAAHSASRQVIRDALELLRREGLVHRLQGTGTLVTPSRLSHDFDVLQGPQEAVEHRMLGIVEEIASPAVARRLGIALGERCGVVERVTLLGGAPLDVSTTYVHAAFLPHAIDFDPNDDWFELYGRAGIELGLTEHAIEASVTDPYLAQLLEVPAGHPLLVLERVVHDADGAPVEWGFTRIRGDRITLHQRMPGRRAPGAAAPPGPPPTDRPADRPII